MEENGNVNIRETKPSRTRLPTVDVNLYNVEERPPFVFSFLNAVQIVICQVLNLIWLPLVLTPHLCLLPADPTRVHLVSTAFFVSGVVSTMQSTLGLRLPSVAAPSVLYTVRFISLLQTERECPSTGDLFAMGPDSRALEWQARLRELQGVLVLAGTSQVILGFSGIQALLCRVFSPVVIAPSVILVGLSVMHKPLSIHLDIDWMLSFIVTLSLITFSFCLQGISLPLPTFSLQSGLTARSFPVFRMFPVLWTCATVYLIYYKAGSIFLPNTSSPNTAAIDYQEAVDNSNWFFFSLPFEWGLPTLSMASAVHMLPAILLQTFTSMVMFYGNAKSCGMASPTHSAVGRGLGIEGLGLILGAFWAHGVSSNSANIGLMSFSGVVSRSSVQLASLLMALLSHFTRLTAWLADIPIQFLTALHLCLYISLISVGFSVLKYINCSSRRDCFVVGFSLLFGLTVPQYVSQQDNALAQYLLSPAGLGVSSALLLDLSLPGKESSKEFNSWRHRSEGDMKTYRLPTWEELLCSILQNTFFFWTN